MSKQLKKLLKETKELISQKQYDDALAVASQILEEDDKNYFGLVFAGRCEVELGRLPEAEKLYLSATEVDAGQPPAWQGLAQMYSRQEAWPKLKECYSKLRNLISDEAKLMELRKDELILAVKMSCYEEVINTLMTDQTLAASQFQREIIFSLPLRKYKEEHWTFIKKTYEDALRHDGKLPPENHYRYAKLLHEHVDEGCYECTALLLEMVEEDGERELEDMMLSTVLEQFVYFDKSPDDKQVAFVEEYLDATEDEPRSVDHLSLIILCQGDRTIQEVTDFIMSSDFYKKRTSNYLFAFMLGQLNWSKYDFWAAEKYYRNALKIARLQELPVKLSVNNQLELARALLRQKSAKAIAEAMGLLDGIADPYWKCKASIIRAEVYLASDDIEGARTALSDARSCFSDGSRYRSTLGILEAEMLVGSGNYEAARTQLESMEDSEEAAFLLAMVAKELSDTQVMLTNLTKTARLNQYHPMCWYHLGTYYASLGTDATVQKGLKCLELAFQRNPRSPETALALTDLHIQQGSNNKVQQVLEEFCSLRQPLDAKWAWLRLVQAQLIGGEVDKAVQTVQSLHRWYQDDPHVWRALAGAYAARGSLYTALKCYERILEMEEISDPLYKDILFQTASVQARLSNFPSAEASFGKLLELDLTQEESNHFGIAYCQCLQQHAVAMFDIRHYGHALQLTKECFERFRASRELTQSWTEIHWKTLADGLVFLSKFSSDKVLGIGIDWVFDPAFSAGSMSDDFCMQDLPIKPKVFCAAACSYLQLMQSEQSVSVDGIVDYASALISAAALLKTNIPDLANKFLGRAITSLKRCLSTPKFSVILMLGNAYVLSGQLALAQHCYIKAIETDRHSPLPWCHLGLLYLNHAKVELAHECFKRAQACDPTCDLPWIGQALVAETVYHEETIHLYRHAADMSHEALPLHGYARQVLQYVSLEKRNRSSLSYQYTVTKVHAAAAARDACQRALGECCHSRSLAEDSALGQFLLGCFYELEDLNSGAERAYTCALKLSTASPAQEKACQKSLCRIYGKLGSAMAMRRLGGQLDDDDFYSNVMRAVAFARLTQWDRFRKLGSAMAMRRLGGQLDDDDFYSNVMRAVAFARLTQWDRFRKLGSAMAMRRLGGQLDGDDFYSNVMRAVAFARLTQWDRFRKLGSAMAMRRLGGQLDDDDFYSNVMRAVAFARLTQWDRFRKLGSAMAMRRLGGQLDDDDFYSNVMRAVAFARLTQWDRFRKLGSAMAMRRLGGQLDDDDFYSNVMRAVAFARLTQWDRFRKLGSAMAMRRLGGQLDDDDFYSNVMRAVAFARLTQWDRFRKLGSAMAMRRLGGQLDDDDFYSNVMRAVAFARLTQWDRFRKLGSAMAMRRLGGQLDDDDFYSNVMRAVAFARLTQWDRFRKLGSAMAMRRLGGQLDDDDFYSNVMRAVAFARLTQWDRFRKLGSAMAMRRLGGQLDDDDFYSNVMRAVAFARLTQWDRFRKLGSAMAMRRLGGQLDDDDFYSNVMRAVAFARLTQWDRSEEFLARCVYSATEEQAVDLRCAQGLVAILIGGDDLPRAMSLLSDNLIPAPTHAASRAGLCLMRCLANQWPLREDFVKMNPADPTERFARLCLVALFGFCLKQAAPSLIQWLYHQYPHVVLSAALFAWSVKASPPILHTHDECSIVERRVNEAVSCWGRQTNANFAVQRLLHSYPDATSYRRMLSPNN